MHTYQVEREPKGEYSKPSAATAVRQFILDRNDFSGSRCLAHANNHAHHSRQLDLEKGKYRSSATASFLSLLLDCAARRCTRPAVDGLGTATTALLFCGALVVITAVIVVVVNLHLARCRLIHWCRLRRRCALLFLPWSRRHAWWRRLGDGLHRRQSSRWRRRRRVVCGFRRVVGGGWALFVHPSHLRGTAIGRGRHLEGLRRGALHLNFVQSRACVLGRRPLDAVVVFPFTNALWCGATRPLFSLTCGSVSCELRVRWWRCAACNLRHARVRMVLVRRARERSARGGRRVVDQRPNLRTRAWLTVEARYWSVARRWLDPVGWRTATLAEQWLTLVWRLLLLLLLLWWALRRAKSGVLWRQVRRRRLERSGLLVLWRRRHTAVRGRRGTLRLLVRAKRVLSKWVLSRWARPTRCHGWLRLWHAVASVIWVERLWRSWRILELCDPVASPVVASGKRWWRWPSRRAVVRLCPPWLTWRTTKCARLIRLRVDILRQRCASLVREAIGGLTFKQRQACLDVDVCGIEISSASVRIERVAGLIVARLIQGAKVVPDFGNVGVEANGARVRVKRIAVLVDLVVKHTDRAPECWVTAIAVHGLLVSLVGLGVLLLRHVASTKQVPALSIILICQ
jgi:hypothetical protein